MSTATAWSQGRVFACNCLKSAEICPVSALEMQYLPWTKWKSKTQHMHTPPEAPVNTDISAWLKSCSWWFWNQPTGMQIQSNPPAGKLEGGPGELWACAPGRASRAPGVQASNQSSGIPLPDCVTLIRTLSPPSLGFPVCQVRLRMCLPQMG